jgi:1,2-dihydroxy-3-keto-5-methylthiopentene dioxygenase
MSTLKVFSTDQAQLQECVEEHDAIATRLHEAGVLFERWQAAQPLAQEVGQEEVIAAYRSSVDHLMQDYGFQSVDVVALTSEHPDRAVLRQKFLDEHTHSEFEVRFFVDGKGLFYIHQDDKVYGVMCEQGDLISVPAGTRHWFDMGEAPSFKCIRLFTSPEGWAAQYTSDEIANHFPRFEQF